MGNLLGEDKKARSVEIADLPDGLKELVEMPKEESPSPILLLPAQDKICTQTLPALESKFQYKDKPAQHLPAAPAKQPQRPKTQKEQELDLLIAQRQGIIEKLKTKNPQVVEARKKIAGLVPAIRGSGASHTMKLAAETEHIEFSIATEAYTPKKEKELIKRLRDIRQELSKHKEIDDARKAVDAERRHLHELVSDVRTLEHELDGARRKCDAVYAEVLAERKAAYEHRQKNREERERKQFEELKTRVRDERRKRYDDEIKPYMKDYSDTVSMDEICQIEKKERKDRKERD